MFIAKECEYVVFDVETTGFNPLDGDRMIELAGIKIKNGQKIDEFESFIDPERPLSVSAMEINKITEEMIVGAPKRAEVLSNFVDFIGGACLVAHNAPFDIKFLCFELSLIGRKLNKATPVMDTLKLAKEILPHLGAYRLGYLAHSFGVPITETHRALSDVALTVDVFKKMLDVAGDQNLIQFNQLIDKFGVQKPEYRIQEESQATLF